MAMEYDRVSRDVTDIIGNMTGEQAKLPSIVANASILKRLDFEKMLGSIRCVRPGYLSNFPSRVLCLRIRNG